MAMFHGFCDDDANVAMDDRNALVNHLRSLKGKEFYVIVEEKTRRRTARQNAYLHAEPFEKLAQHWGESVARTKLICMGAFWGYEPCRISGALLPVKVHTSDMTVEQATHFLDWLIPWALQEHGVEIDLPRERTAA